MSQLLSRKNFMINLCKRGLPARYAWRVSKELNDHATDMADHQSEAELGNPEILLNDFEAAYKQRTFGGRHPVLIFLMFPLPIVIMLYLMSIFLPYFGISIIHLLSKYIGIHSFVDSTEIRSLAIYTSLTVFPTIVPTIFIFRWARRSGINLKYATLSCLPVLLMALLFVTTTLPSNAESAVRGAFWIKQPLWRLFGLEPGQAEPAWPLPEFNQIMQIIMCALVIFYLIHHEKVKQRRLMEKLVTEE